MKIIAGKHAGTQGKLVGLVEEEAEVLVKKQTWLRFFHVTKYVIVRPAELEVMSAN